MDEIRKKLEDAKELLEAGLDESVYEAIDEALALLPPEGETRAERNEKILDDILAIAQVDSESLEGVRIRHAIRIAFAKDACAFRHKQDAEPTPSSEKALRAFVEKVAETGPRTGEDARDWQREAQYLLASLPAPSNKGTPDGHTS